jgi:hypothetical protein
MRKYITLFFSVLVLLFACKGNKSSVEIISSDRMTNLLTDVHITDGSLYSVMQTPDSLYRYGMGKYVTLFKTYHTDSTQFRKSLEYYALKPDELVIIYTQVQKNLQKKNDSLVREQDKENQALPKK